LFSKLFYFLFNFSFLARDAKIPSIERMEKIINPVLTADISPG
jgi:hypothetical protein